MIYELVMQGSGWRHKISWWLNLKIASFIANSAKAEQFAERFSSLPLKSKLLALTVKSMSGGERYLFFL